MVTGLLCTSMLLVASSCNLCLLIVKFYLNIKKFSSVNNGKAAHSSVNNKSVTS